MVGILQFFAKGAELVDPFQNRRFQGFGQPLIEGLGKPLADEAAANLAVPDHQGRQIGDIDDVVDGLAFHLAENAGNIGCAASPAPAFEDQPVRLELILAVDRAGSDNRSISDAAGPDQPALPAQKNRTLVEHHPVGDIADQRWGGLVLIGRKVEMDVGTAHLAVVAAAGASGHQAVAEVDQAAQGHERKQDGLLQPHRVGNPGLLFQDGTGPHMGARTGLGPFQKNGIFKEAAL